jgi:hypothetical protein
MEKYSENWVQEEWAYDESEMEQELFDHRLGEFPVLEMIVASMPITTEDKIPSDGRHRERDSEGAQVMAKASVSEAEAVLIDNHGESLILKTLFKTSPKFGAANAAEPTERLYSYVDGDIKAVWDSNTRKGVSTYFSCQLAIQLGCVLPEVPVVSYIHSFCLVSLIPEIYAPCLCKHGSAYRYKYKTVVAAPSLDSTGPFDGVSWGLV